MADELMDDTETPQGPLAYSLAGDGDHGWTVHATGLTFEEVMIFTHTLGHMFLERRKTASARAKADATIAFAPPES